MTRSHVDERAAFHICAFCGIAQRNRVFAAVRRIFERAVDGQRMRIEIDAQYDSVVPTMLSGLPTILIAVVVILVLSASMSTLSSLVLASSSTLTLDSTVENKKLTQQAAFVVRFQYRP